MLSDYDLEIEGWMGMQRFRKGKECRVGMILGFHGFRRSGGLRGRRGKYIEYIFIHQISTRYSATDG